MNVYIKNIILFLNDGSIRDVPLEPGLNIITGDSKTGKSALIEIVDYCLFSSRSTIPIGKISDNTAYYCIILKFPDNYLIIARPNWKDRNKHYAYVTIETNDDFLNDFSFNYFDNKELKRLEFAKQEVESYLGLSVLDTRESQDEDRQSAGKASIRNAVPFLFQHQNLIANKHSLFYRFDDIQRQKKTVKELPIFLNWVKGQYYFLKQQEEEIRKKLAIENKLTENESNTKEKLIQKLKVPISLYYEAINYPPLSEEISYEELKKLAANLPDIPNNIYEKSNVEIEQNKLQLQREELNNKLIETNLLIGKLNFNSEDLSLYHDSLMKHTTLATETLHVMESDPECPICCSKTPHIKKIITDIYLSKEELKEELSKFKSYHHDNSEHLSLLMADKRKLVTQIKTLTDKINYLSSVSNLKENKDKTLKERLMYLKGIIKNTMDNILEGVNFIQHKADVKNLTDELNTILSQLKTYNTEHKYFLANQFISSKMTEICKKLDIEEELKSGEMAFDLRNFQFSCKANKQTIRLSEMGSGANWLACHLSLFLSLLHLICKENACIPAILFLDQPSQVYFPQTTKIFSAGKEDNNIVQVRNIFNVILDEINEIEENYGFLPQVIVMEHADEATFSKYVRKRWYEDGDKLI